jgi:nucleoside-diphosphate-sugar epimerase
MSKPRVIVTGAAGFVGAHLIDRFSRGGWEVLGLVRPGTRTMPVRDGVQFFERDLERVGSLADLLRAGDTVVHLAGRAHVMHDRASDPLAVFRAANVAPTEMICRSAVQAGVSRIVFVSSAKVYGEGRAAPYTLADPLAPVDAYARSKIEAEEVIRSIAGGAGVEWTVLRPPFVYGLGGRGNFPRLVALALLASVLPLPLGGVRNQRSIIFVGNLVDAIHCCVVEPAARDRVFLPTDARDVSTPELLRAIAGVRGRRARLFHFPSAIIVAAACLLGRRAELKRLTESLCLDGSVLRRDLGWQPPFSLEEAVAQSVGAASYAPTLDVHA